VNVDSRGVTGRRYIVRTRRAEGRPMGPDGRAPAAKLGRHWELVAAASRKSVWWDLRLASLLSHLFSRAFSQLCGS